MSELPSALKGKKGSETFLDYVKPFLMFILEDKENATKELIEKALTIPWMIWNASVMNNRPGNTVDYLSGISLRMKDQPDEAKQWIKLLKERKKSLFSQYNYVFGEFKVHFDQITGELRLSIETRAFPELKKERTQ